MKYNVIALILIAVVLVISLVILYFYDPSPCNLPRHNRNIRRTNTGNARNAGNARNTIGHVNAVYGKEWPIQEEENMAKPFSINNLNAYDPYKINHASSNLEYFTVMPSKKPTKNLEHFTVSPPKNQRTWSLSECNNQCTTGCKNEINQLKAQQKGNQTKKTKTPTTVPTQTIQYVQQNPPSAQPTQTTPTITTPGVSVSSTTPIVPITTQVIPTNTANQMMPSETVLLPSETVPLPSETVLLPSETTSAPPSEMIGIPSEEEEANNVWVTEHNRLRATLGLPPVTWNQTIASGATQYATGCQFQHSPNSARMYNGTLLGENLALGSPASSYNDLAMMQLWEAEKQYYTYPQGPSESTTGQTGHYTQMINKNVTQIGCGCATCGTSRMCVCRYLPIQIAGQAPY